MGSHAYAHETYDGFVSMFWGFQESNKTSIPLLPKVLIRDTLV